MKTEFKVIIWAGVFLLIIAIGQISREPQYQVDRFINFLLYGYFIALGINALDWVRKLIKKKPKDN